MLRSNLKPLLDDRNLSIREFARRINWRPDSVRLLYRDEMERYPRELLFRTCEELNVGLSELFILDAK